MAATLPSALYYGAKGAKVRDFQEALRVQVEPSIKVDGDYGPQTEQFVQKAYRQFSLPPKSRQVTLALYNAVMKIAATPYLGPPVNEVVPTASFFKEPVTAPPPVSPAQPATALPIMVVATTNPLSAPKASQGMKDSTKIAIGLGVLGLVGLLLLKKK